MHIIANYDISCQVPKIRVSVTKLVGEFARKPESPHHPDRHYRFSIHLTRQPTIRPATQPWICNPEPFGCVSSYVRLPARCHYSSREHHFANQILCNAANVRSGGSTTGAVQRGETADQPGHACVPGSSSRAQTNACCLPAAIRRSIAGLHRLPNAILRAQWLVAPSKYDRPSGGHEIGPAASLRGFAPLML